MAVVEEAMKETLMAVMVVELTAMVAALYHSVYGIIQELVVVH